MPTVNQFLLDAWNTAPPEFTEKDAALAFLNCDGSVDEKLKRALELLQQVARAAECEGTWKTLVHERLVAAEKAMKLLLPHHRDHVLHSAHLYLLGVTIYLRMLRPHSALAAVLAENYYRDAQAFYGRPETPYSCGARVIDPILSLAANQTRIGSTFILDDAFFQRTGVPCSACSPADLAQTACDTIAQLRGFEHCCGPASAIQNAVHYLADAVGSIGERNADPLSCLPRTTSDLDGVFRRRWGQAAILHDAAYPLELAAEQIADYLEHTVKPLGCTFSPCPEPFGLTLNRVCDLVAVPLIQSVCSIRFNPCMCTDNAVSLLATNLSHKLHVDYTPDTLARMMVSWLETELHAGKLDHGVFSALLMLRLVNKELIDRLGERRRDTTLVNDNTSRAITPHRLCSAVEFYYIECVDAAASVYLHNTKKYMPLFKNRELDYRDHPFAWLLFLCDQLQEWLRPSGDTDSMVQFQRAKEYHIDLVDGPQLHFDFPEKGADIRETFRQHLRLFGQEFVKRAE